MKIVGTVRSLVGGMVDLHRARRFCKRNGIDLTIFRGGDGDAAIVVQFSSKSDVETEERAIYMTISALIKIYGSIGRPLSLDYVRHWKHSKKETQ